MQRPLVGSVVQWSCFLCCLVAVVLLATIRSPPVYGKLDFIMLDSRPWWPRWKPLIETAKNNSANLVYSDYITSYILAGVFGLSPVLSVRGLPSAYPILSVVDMETSKLPHRRLLDGSVTKAVQEGRQLTCIVNLLGFQPSWVPVETRHWHVRLAKTSGFYEFTGEVIDSSWGTMTANCFVFSSR